MVVRLAVIVRAHAELRQWVWKKCMNCTSPGCEVFWLLLSRPVLPLTDSSPPSPGGIMTLIPVNGALHWCQCLEGGAPGLLNQFQARQLSWWFVLDRNHSGTATSTPPPSPLSPLSAHTHTIPPLSHNPWGTQRAIDWLSCSPLRQIDNHCVLPALHWRGEAG